jgi:hypothetical protein
MLEKAARAMEQIEQRHRFLAQRMDDVMIVDDENASQK